MQAARPHRFSDWLFRQLDKGALPSWHIRFRMQRGLAGDWERAGSFTRSQQDMSEGADGTA